MRSLALLLCIVAPCSFALPVIPAIPFAAEPGSLTLLAIGLVGVALIRRRQG